VDSTAALVDAASAVAFAAAFNGRVECLYNLDLECLYNLARLSDRELESL
jgi:hypothetical protein